MISMLSVIQANRLLFETSSGTLTNFDLDEGNTSKNPIVTPGNISTYGGSAEYWSRAGFVGRLVYEGEPNTISVTNIGPTATGENASFNRFYYTRVQYYDGNSDPSVWREVFFVARVKARKHDPGIYTGHNSNNNFIIDNPGDTFTVPGAGAESANPGELAYNGNGDSGMYNVADGFTFKYPYRYVWVDFTAIRTSRTRNLSGGENKGYYESIIRLDGVGVQQVLSLEGFFAPYSYDIGPDAFSFAIERLAPEIIPYEILKTHTTYTNSYLVGHVRFHFTDKTKPVKNTGTVSFSADSNGLSTDFRFTSTASGTAVSFPYTVVFDPVICGNKTSPSTVTSSNNSFTTKYGRVDSVIDTQYSNEIALTGDVRIFLPGGGTTTTYPPAQYSSTMYAFVIIN